MSKSVNSQYKKLTVFRDINFRLKLINIICCFPFKLTIKQINKRNYSLTKQILFALYHQRECEPHTCEWSNANKGSQQQFKVQLTHSVPANSSYTSLLTLNDAKQATAAGIIVTRIKSPTSLLHQHFPATVVLHPNYRLSVTH